MDKLLKLKVSRRSVLQAGAVGAAMMAMPGVSFAEVKKVVIAVWGGPIADALESIYGAAFAGSDIASIEMDKSGPEAAKVRAMVEVGNVTWDIGDLSIADCTLLGEAGMVRPMDYAIVPKDAVLPGMAYEYAVANYLFSSIISYDKKALGGTGPTSWAEFWDVEKFPGKRTLRRHIEGVIEAAVQAGGVPVDKIYPIDEDLAFEKIKELLPHVIFWNSGSESQQLMRDGEVVMGDLWSTRATQLLKEDPERFALDFNGGLLLPGAWGVIADNPAGDTAFQVVAKQLDPEIQAKVFEATGLSPSNPAAEAFVPADLAAINPTSAANAARQQLVDVAWYTENQERVQTKFLELISG